MGDYYCSLVYEGQSNNHRNRNVWVGRDLKYYLVITTCHGPCFFMFSQSLHLACEISSSSLFLFVMHTALKTKMGDMA